MKKTGRPSKYTIELAKAICIETATSSKSLRTICKSLDVGVSTVLEWLYDNKTFADMYTRAKEEQADFLAEEIIEIADDSSKDTMKQMLGGKEVEVENKEWTNRSRLKVDARKWVASKLKPRKYGEKLDIQQKITVEQPLFPDVQTDNSE